MAEYAGDNCAAVNAFTWAPGGNQAFLAQLRIDYLECLIQLGVRVGCLASVPVGNGYLFGFQNLGNVLSESSRHQLESWLQQNKTGELMIRAAVPRTWSVGDKTGRCGNGTTNDLAIIRPPVRGPILVAIYSTGSTSVVDDRAGSVAEATRAVVDFLTGRDK